MVLVLILLFLIARTQYYYVSFIILYYRMHVIITIYENYIIKYSITNHTKILILSYSSSRLHKKYIS